MDQGLHPGRGVLHPDQIIAAFFPETVAPFLLHPVAEGLDLPEGLLKVMRGNKGKIFQFPVALCKLLDIRFSLVFRFIKTLGHFIEGMGKPADLVVALDVHPVIEIPSGNDLGPFLQETEVGKNPSAEKKGNQD